MAGALDLGRADLEEPAAGGPARTAFTAVGVGLGVGLIVALLAITNGVHRTAGDLMHVGRADFGLYQSDVVGLHALVASRVSRRAGCA